jgi:protein TonB
MKTATVAVVAVGILAGCTNAPPPPPSRPSAYVERPVAAPAIAVARPSANMSLDRYKRLLAQHIVQTSPDKIYPGNPQAMLRSVVVVKYVIDVNGRLMHSDVLRSNGDSVTVGTALAALRTAAPFPPPPSNLVSHGSLEILETMLFNDDGRFQMRSIASAQLDE